MAEERRTKRSREKCNRKRRQRSKRGRCWIRSGKEQPGKDEHGSGRIDVEIKKLDRGPNKTRKKHLRRRVDCQVAVGGLFPNRDADARCLTQGSVSLPVTECGENDETRRIRSPNAAIALSRFLHGGTITILVRAKPPFPPLSMRLERLPGLKQRFQPGKNTWPSIGAGGVSGVVLSPLVMRHHYFCGFGLGHQFQSYA